MRLTFLLLSGAFLVSSPGHACVLPRGIDLRDIFTADAVVVGRIHNYEVMRPAENHAVDYSYARFSVQVDPGNGLLTAKPGFKIPADGRIELTWINSTFGFPERLGNRPGEEYLIALERWQTAPPHLNTAADDGGTDGSATEFTILQRPCSAAFLFMTKTLKGAILRQVMATERDKERELEILMDFLPAAERALAEARRYERTRKD